MSTVAIILAGGTGTRFNTTEPKQFGLVGRRPLLEICLAAFQDHPGLDGIILVAPVAHLSRVEKMVEAAAFHKVKKILPGGKSRQESSAIGIAAAADSAENILIHDAARALVAPAVIGRVLEALAGSKAVMPVIPASDTIIRVDDANLVTAVLDRGKLRHVQTPQGFRLEIIRRAHERARSEGYAAAGDDCSLVLRYKLAPVVTVAGDPDNIKITVPQDMALAETILKVRSSKFEVRG